MSRLPKQLSHPHHAAKARHSQSVPRKPGKKALAFCSSVLGAFAVLSPELATAEAQTPQTETVTTETKQFCQRALSFTQYNAQDATSSQPDLSHNLNWRSITDNTPVPATVDQDALALCGGYYVAPQLKALPPGNAQEAGRLFGWAYFYKYDSGGTATLCGDVLLRKDDLQVRSDTVEIDEQSQTAKLAGAVTLTTADSILRGDSALVRFEQDSTILSRADFFLYGQRARGTADQIITENSSRTIINGGEYTTCPPGNNDWRLIGEQITLDHDTGWGELSHMRLKLGEVPIFYAPYFRFPLNDARHTGLLYPEFNSLSEPDIAIPFYWNIAPNYDWLIKPRKIGGRGMMLESEFRYLHQPGEGNIKVGFLAEDRKFNDEDRKSARWAHRGNLFEHWSWRADVGYISDNEYLDDLGASLQAIGESFIPRTLTLEGGTGAWRTSLLVQSFQTIDAAIADTDQPYRKLPELTVSHTANLLQHRLEWHNALTYTYLAQPLASEAPYAHRTHWASEISLPLQAPWYFFTPRFTLQSSYYDLMGNDLSDTSDRYVPTSSIDAGLFFDRPLKIAQTQWTQTLEPRIFHAYTPFRQQDWLPVFDTTALTFGFDQLFRADRFTGIDRIGDTHQTTVAVTSRLLDATRSEKAKLTVGQILFHEDRAVSLPGETALTGTQSPLLIRGESRLPWAMAVSSGLTWDSGQNILEDGNLQLTRTNNPDRAWQTSYRYRKAATNNDRIEQISLATRQRLQGAWHFVASVHFDVENTNTLEQLTGLQYEDCCWRADFVYHRRIRSSNDLSDTAQNRYAFLFQFELKGLGGVGSRLESLLKETIPGY